MGSDKEVKGLEGGKQEDDGRAQEGKAEGEKAEEGKAETGKEGERGTRGR